MKFIIKSTKMKLSDSLKDYIKERIGSCQKYININFPIMTRVEVEKTTEHHRKGKIFRAEVNIKLKDKFLRVEAVRDDIYLAINEVRDDLKRELKKHKEIIVEKHHRSSKKYL